MIIEKIQQFQEVARSKEILIHQQLADKEVCASKYLVEILLNNLFSNAIRHNERHGRIEISLDSDKLVIKNTGQPIKLGSEQIFERFQKSKESSGMGLGVALVKNICRQYGFNIRHDFA